MRKHSSVLVVVLLLLLATGVLSATTVPVGQLSFLNNEAGEQSFMLYNYTSVLTDMYPAVALSFENLALTVTFADGSPVTGPVTKVVSGSFLPADTGYSTELYPWVWTSSTHGVITSATLTGRISPALFDVGGTTFSSTGVLNAYLDLSGNTISDYYPEAADITVSDTPASSPVPEPGTLALLAGPVIAFAFRRIRK